MNCCAPLKGEGVNCYAPLKGEGVNYYAPLKGEGVYAVPAPGPLSPRGRIFFYVPSPLVGE